LTSVQRNNVKISGKGSRVIMFAHGYGCDQAMWRSVAPSFENDYKVILFDYVGSGHSDPTAFSRTQYSTLRGYAADVIAIIEELKLEKVNFIAHSVSSMIGALAAIQRPDLFENLVMIGPSPSYINDGEYLGGFERSDIEDLLEMLNNNHSGWSAMMAPIIVGNPERPELAAELEASFCNTDPIHAQHFARVTFLSDNRADLLNLRSRTLILQCDKDAIAPVSVGQYVQRCIPKSQLIVMEATGHCPHLSSPGVVTQAIQDFL
jgi:sigma-B regulation protein RsbQ